MKLFVVALAIIGYLGTCQGSEGEALNVTLAVFSGVPDPQWLITPKSLNYQKIKKLLSAAKTVRGMYLPEQMPSQLGYKGFLVHEDGQDKPSLILGPKTTELQEMLLKSCPKATTFGRRVKKILSKSLKKSLARIIKDAKDLPVDLEKGKSRAEKRFPPIFEGANKKWNRPDIQPNNNCYNYGNDKFTNTYAQPGKASRHPFLSVTFDEVEKAAKSDGLVRVEPGPGGKIPVISKASLWHLVALVVDPGYDFHWYRLDSNGRWSHKPGQAPITNLDGNGNLIDDPREAANFVNRPQYQFVCFMKTHRFNVHIR